MDELIFMMSIYPARGDDSGVALSDHFTLIRWLINPSKNAGNVRRKELLDVVAAEIWGKQ